MEFANVAESCDWNSSSSCSSSRTGYFLWWTVLQMNFARPRYPRRILREKKSRGTLFFVARRASFSVQKVISLGHIFQIVLARFSETGYQNLAYVCVRSQSDLLLVKYVVNMVLDVGKKPKSIWNRIIDSTAKKLLRTVCPVLADINVLLFLLHNRYLDFARTSPRWRFRSLQLFFCYLWLLRLPKLMNKG